MVRKEELFELIRGGGRIPAPITLDTDVYRDLGYDSMSFIALLLAIETAYGVSFGLVQMGGLAQVGGLLQEIQAQLGPETKG